MEAITTALTTAVGTVSTDAIGAIAAVLPAALAVMGAMLVIRIGIKTFNLASKKG